MVRVEVESANEHAICFSHTCMLLILLVIFNLSFSCDSRTFDVSTYKPFVSRQSRAVLYTSAIEEHSFRLHYDEIGRYTNPPSTLLSESGSAYLLDQLPSFLVGNPYYNSSEVERRDHLESTPCVGLHIGESIESVYIVKKYEIREHGGYKTARVLELEETAYSQEQYPIKVVRVTVEPPSSDKPYFHVISEEPVSDYRFILVAAVPIFDLEEPMLSSTECYFVVSLGVFRDPLFAAQVEDQVKEL